MAAPTPARLVLIVTGSTLRAEEVDRPLAYYLKQQIELDVPVEPLPDVLGGKSPPDHVGEIR